MWSGGLVTQTQAGMLGCLGAQSVTCAHVSTAQESGQTSPLGGLMSPMTVRVNVIAMWTSAGWCNNLCVVRQRHPPEVVGHELDQNLGTRPRAGWGAPFLIASA